MAAASLWPSPGRAEEVAGGAPLPPSKLGLMADDDDAAAAPLAAEVAEAGDAAEAPDSPEAPVAPAVAEEERLPNLGLLVAEPVRGVESSGFGWRDDPIRHRRRFHRGNDFRADRGTPVYAAGAGTVIWCSRRGGYGRSIDIRHADGLVTRYGHLSKILVTRGQQVDADAEIGLVGSTGRATGPHLHFEVRIHDRAVDPQIAVHVGELQRHGTPKEIATAAIALRPETQAASVSTLDPPRARRAADEAKSRRRHRHRPVS